MLRGLLQYRPLTHERAGSPRLNFFRRNTSYGGKKAVNLKQERQPMPEQAPDVRKRNFEEVPIGYSPEAAMKEAERCLQCKKPACVEGCPVEVDIPGFIQQIKPRVNLRRRSGTSGAETAFRPYAAGSALRRASAKAPASSAKRANRSRSAISSGLRLIARARPKPRTCPRSRAGNRQEGSPWSAQARSGLTVAGDLVLKGHDVTVFEAFHKAGWGAGVRHSRIPSAQGDCALRR
jgi:glutamate synthase (NADPH) small chain